MIVETPFPYSQYVTGKHFVGRQNDVTLLGNLISQGENVVIYEPPKTGKTSLIQQTLLTRRMSGSSFKVGQMSALNIRTPEEFLTRLGSTIIQMVASTPEQYRKITERYLSGTHFVFDTEAFASEGKILSMGWDLDQADVRTILRFPFVLAQETGEKLILIIDEFYCLGYLDNPDIILRPLDASLREFPGSKFSYIFTGSAVNAMKAIFADGFLFHRVVERVRLSPVEDRDMAANILRGFNSAGKVISQELLQAACTLFKGHLWYINHFAAICDSMSRGYIMEPLLVDALGCLLSVHEPRFNDMVNSLTTHQVNLLRATVEGVNRFSAASVIREYALNSSANVKRVKDALMKKEILVFDQEDNPHIQDPLFEYWVRKYYFQIKD